MPPDTPPPDDARRPTPTPTPAEGNVVDPEVLAERRAQRAEQSEQSAARRAADAQVLAAQLARERARLEAERDAARAEAAAAREGADAAIAEARHVQEERDTLRDALIQARTERDALAAERDAAQAAGPDLPDDAAHADPTDADDGDAPAGPTAATDSPDGDAPADATVATDSDGGDADADATVATGSDDGDADADATVATDSDDSAVPAGPTAVTDPHTPAPSNGDSGTAPTFASGSLFRRELAVARTAAASAPPSAPKRVPPAPVPGLERERRLTARLAEAGPSAGAMPPAAAEAARQPRPDRAAPITALVLERERSSRLQAQLDSSLAIQRQLRTHIAALQRAVHQRVEAERRIEVALRRVREELTAANLLAATERPARPERPVAPPQATDATVPAPEGLAADTAAGPPPSAAPASSAATDAPADASAAPSAAAPEPSDGEPAAPAAAAAPVPAATDGAPDALTVVSAPAPAAVEGAGAAPATPVAPEATAPDATSSPAEAGVAPPAEPAPELGGGLDPLRLSAARERLRAAAPSEPPVPLPTGTSTPWVTAALQRLLATDPDTAGRIAVGLLPALGLAAQRPLRCDVLLSGRGCLAIDIASDASTTVVPRPAPRPRSAIDLSVAGDYAGFARLLHGRRSLRRPARVRGGRRALRELRRLARAPLGLRDLAAARVTLEPALALQLVALAIDPAATSGERFSIAHAPLAGGPVDAWLRIADGAPPVVLDAAPPELARLTLRCTRGALLPLIAGVEPPPGEGGVLEGDEAALVLVRSWIAATERAA